MRKLLILPLIVCSLLVLMPLSHETTVVPWGSAPTAGSSLFYDDFLSSGFPSQWSSANLVNTNTAVQVGGYLLSTVQRSALAVTNIGVNLVIANVSGNPPIGSLNPESVQFVQIVYRMAPFNFTSPTTTQSGTSYATSGEVQFGLNLNSCCLGNAIYFDVFSSTSPLSNIKAGFPVSKQAIFLDIFKPMASATSNFVSARAGGGAVNATLYNGGSAPIDLNAVHIFTIQIQMDLGNNANDYVRFEVDDNGWEGYQQTACSCIVGLTGDVASMFPFINTVLFTNAPAAPSTTSQSLASQTDYVWVTNYVPVSLPPGQILVPVGHGPATLPQPGRTGSITDFIQFEANGISPGNLYGGGMLLTIIVSGIIFAVLFGLSRRWNIPVKNYGLFFTMFVLVLSFFFFIAGVLPIWIPAMMVLIMAGIAFGVIRSGASGGLVPD